MRIKTSKRKEIACLTFCVFYAFYVREKYLRGGKSLVCGLYFFVLFVLFMLFVRFVRFARVKSFCKKKNKLPDTLIYITTVVMVINQCVLMIDLVSLLNHT